MHRLLHLCLGVTLLLSVVRADEKPCTAREGDNFYDLTPLKSSSDYEFKSPSGEAFILNVCKPVSNTTWVPQVDRPEDVAGFTRRARGDFSIGDVNTTLYIRDGHPMLIMTDGSPCPLANELTASTVVRFVCDTSVFGAGNPYLVAQLPPDDLSACSFFIEWRTHVACPTHEKGGAWGFLSILAAILATVFMIYILVGTFYNRYVLELRGFDQIPRWSFCSLNDTLEYLRSLRDRVRDGSAGSGYSSASWSGRRNWRGDDGYRGVAEEEEAMMDGPQGFLDEQDDEEANHQHPPRAPPSTAEAGTVSSGPGAMDEHGVVRL